MLTCRRVRTRGNGLGRVVPQARIAVVWKGLGDHGCCDTATVLGCRGRQVRDACLRVVVRRRALDAAVVAR